MEDMWREVIALGEVLFLTRKKFHLDLQCAFMKVTLVLRMEIKLSQTFLAKCGALTLKLFSVGIVKAFVPFVLMLFLNLLLFPRFKSFLFEMALSHGCS